MATKNSILNSKIKYDGRNFDENKNDKPKQQPKQNKKPMWREWPKIISILNRKCLQDTHHQANNKSIANLKKYICA